MSNWYCPIHGLQTAAQDCGYAVICPVCNRACVEEAERPARERETPDLPAPEYDFKQESVWESRK